ncbi:MAG: hypothetical protein HOD63_03400 [Bacteroidetes bacterium]|jgi:hypothetical protein|nr:hypothetical protein [Bacteroidota bacterium]MBT3424785.1 hypothetical protein [Bacteroidota bacterium]MBT3800255.1 hypothetical protein [Bacteroidota bacterium]MBT3935248.1 hypothetical protein [Bacteroidota bacterium]MBT4337612.1 hypothetical protein [Bacteroidota bacterium]
MRKQFIISSFLLFIVLFTFHSFLSCNNKLPESIPTISISIPNTRAPLYYNLDTMILIGQINDQQIIKKVDFRMEDKDMKTVYSRSYEPNALQFEINDSLPLIVDDHTNYIFYITATNESMATNEYSLFIHVMP